MDVLTLRNRNYSLHAEPYLARSRNKDGKYNTIISAKDIDKIKTSK